MTELLKCGRNMINRHQTVLATFIYVTNVVISQKAEY